ncbi:MAG TPA: hypothetical protein VGF06_08535 [Terriglobales bacterium]
MNIFRKLSGMLLCTALVVLLAPAQQNGDWISLCSKCLSASVSSKSGIGTTHAVAEGKVTLNDAEMWCGSWEPDSKTCPKEQLANEKGQVYKISANCPAGKLSSFDGSVYTHTSEVWDTSDVGGGKPKFRGQDGQIVGRDNASGGLDLAANWELLCPGSKAGTTDPCAGKPHCHSNASFSAEVVQLTGSIVGGRHHLVKMSIRFQNLTQHPITLAYVTGTSGAVDNLNNSYYWGRAGTHDVSTQGIGIVEGRKADTQFRLAPGESREAVFAVIRYEAARKPLGTSFNYNTTIAELQVQGNLVNVANQYSLRFPHLPDRGW